MYSREVTATLAHLGSLSHTAGAELYLGLGPIRDLPPRRTFTTPSTDQSGPARRLNAPGLATQLRANYNAIKCIRRRNFRADNVLQTFRTCFHVLGKRR
jgi:hypothetical protein